MKSKLEKSGRNSIINTPKLTLDSIERLIELSKNKKKINKSEFCLDNPVGGSKLKKCRLRNKFIRSILSQAYLENDTRYICFDEAGYTGQDLCNTDQPVFTLSSVNFSEKESEQLLNLISTNADEIKFNRLRKYPKFVDELEKLLNHELISENTVRIAISHKKYSIIAQIVDRLIEPVVHIKGFDLYKEGNNLALTNLLFQTLPIYCDEEILNQSLKAFVQLFRRKREEDIDNFYSIISQLIDSCQSPEISSILIVLLDSRSIINKILEGIDNHSLDISATCCFALCDYWGKKMNREFEVLADNSKPLEHYKWFFDILRSNSLKEMKIGYGSRTVSLPLKISKFSLEDSKSYKQIQLADILAGAAAYYGKSIIDRGAEDNLSEMIGKSKIAKLFYPIWPHKAVTPQELNMDNSGCNAIDALVEIALNNNKS